MRETVPAPLSIDAVRPRRERREREARRERGEERETPGFTVEGGSDSASAAPLAPRPLGPSAPPTGQARIFVNVGKRDGATVEEIARLLRDGAGVGAGDIYLRDRNAFVSVASEDLDKAIAALSGQMVGGRTIVAEPARPK
jgi:hypothetical protein